jgi:hypothetical protein
VVLCVLFFVVGLVCGIGSFLCLRSLCIRLVLFPVRFFVIVWLFLGCSILVVRPLCVLENTLI